MAGKKIIQLPSLGRNLISTDLLEVSVNGTGSYKITGQEIMNASSVFWGGIGGDISNQTDLQNALNSKANFITKNNTIPFYSADTNQYLNSNFYYLNGDTNSLYHNTNSFGQIVPNLILDTNSGWYQIGAKDNIDWPNPQTGINFNVYNNTFALTVGGPYNPKLNYFDNSFYIMGGSNNLAMISLNDYGAALQHQMGVASMYGSFGVNIDGAQGNVQIQGFNVFMNSQTGIGMYTDKLQFWNANMFDSGTKTQTNKYFKITDENGVEYWVPMYQ